ncbi:MAG: hypothetical protein JNL38_33135 [Myxococcales bacterium]|nr:hypothetical protein [Myxococcales bacterium]
MDLEITFAAWARAFAFTQAIEIPIYLVLVRGRARALRAFGASAITHPILWWVIPPLWPSSYLAYVVFGESFVVVTEAVFLRVTGHRERWWSLRSPLLLSFAANAASCGLGILCRELFNWP